MTSRTPSLAWAQGALSLVSEEGRGGGGILVSTCDKLANLLAILFDLTEIEEAAWARTGGKVGSLGYDSELVSLFSAKVPEPLDEALKRDLAAVLERVPLAETCEFVGDSVFVVRVFFITFADDCVHASGSDVDSGIYRARGNADGGRTYGYRSPGNGDEGASVTPEGHERGQG